MKFTFTFLFPLIIACFSKADQQNSTDISDVLLRFKQKISSSFKIVNGTIANFKEFPYAVFIYADLDDSGYACTGSLIGKGVIMTAAHCLYDDLGFKTRASSIYVSVGSASNILGNPNIYKASLTIPHQRFSYRSLGNDIGLIRYVPSSFGSSSYAKIYSSKVSDDLPAKAAGWGVTSNDDIDSDDNLPPDLLMSTPIQISSSNICSTLYSPWTSNDGNQICTTIVDGQDTCFGDSGGPLAYSGVTPMPIIGITSFGLSESYDPASKKKFKCGSVDGVGFYTHAINYIDWISDNTGIDKKNLIYYDSAVNQSSDEEQDAFISPSDDPEISVSVKSVYPQINSSALPPFNYFISFFTLIISIIYLV
ncbi:Serine protease 55 [Smittium mucronatum]|uniref:Serine protease 55 n=1 Tax=Smittium mucronatum TaxID=133383 RepID=A0A1R0GWM0_9FUNG|nr:Serine protease 55 [Smittium mucronatum]